MAQYSYIAKNAAGKKIRGMMSASDEQELHRKLKEEGLFLISAGTDAAARSARPLAEQALAGFARELSVLTGAGITLVRALQIISAAESIRPREREIYGKLLARIRQGASLSGAMEEQNGVFPPLMIQMYRAAESSGRLEETSERLANLYEKQRRAKSRVSGALVYPKILLTMIAVVLLVLMRFVLPRFAALFEQTENIPWSMRVLMAASRTTEQYFPAILAALAALVISAKAVGRIRSVRIWRQKLALHLPFTGKLQKIICSSRFARSLSSLYSSGIPVVSALEIAGRTTGNDYIGSQFKGVLAQVRAGNPISDSLEQVDGFTYKLCDSIRVGEESGKLENMLTSTADSLEYDADLASARLISYVEPVILIAVGLIVSFVMVAVFSTIYGSYNAVAGM